MTENTLSITPELSIPDHLQREVQSRLAYVDEWIAAAAVYQDGERIQLTLNQTPDLDRRADLEEKVQRVVHAMVKGAFKPKVQVLEDHLDRPVVYEKDPMVELEKRGEVVMEEAGVYTLGPLVSRLIAYFEAELRGLGIFFAAEPYRFPTLISARFLERVQYFRAFPHSLTFATHLREDLDVISEFAEHATCAEDGMKTPPDAFAKIKTLLSPAVCYHLYFSLADQTLTGDHLIASAVGNCFRYEAINLGSLERMWNFTMQEVIFVGSKDFVLQNREIAREKMSHFFQTVGLAYRVESANDPFFIGEFRQQTAFQSAFQLKYEIRARIPHHGGTLAIGSYNYHQNFFGRNLNISLPDGSPVHTGCAAFGLERMAYAFLAQFGLDPANWPVAVRESWMAAR